MERLSIMRPNLVSEFANWIHRVWIAASVLLLSQQAGAALLLPRPVFNGEREFSVASPAPAQWLTENGERRSARYAIFDEAARACDLNPSDAKTELESLLKES